MSIKSVPAAKAEMLIRKPVADVFEAFVDPDITSQFWFTKGSARLEPGHQVTWDWDMYGLSIPVRVKAVEPNERILIEWPGQEAPTTVEWVFTPRTDNTTFVSITNTGFSGHAGEIVEQAIASTEGFSYVLAGLKALLEHGVTLCLVADRHPDGVNNH
ncbi:MAG TPA: SRPBCC family protein [Rhodothermales bacterium]|nr:SRPBCC family protein [Rhodothermales bacterium]